MIQGPDSKQEQIIWKAVTLACMLFMAATGIGAFFLLIKTITFFKSVLIPLSIAGVIAYLLHPVVVWMESKGVKKTRAIVLIFVAAVVLFGALCAFVLPKLFDEGSNLIREFPNMVQKVEVRANSWLSNHEDASAKLDDLISLAESELPKYSSKMAEYAWVGVAGVLATLGFILGMVFIPLYVFYFLREQASIQETWQEYIPLHRSTLRDEVVVVVSEINRHMITFFRGQVIVAIILGILTGIGLMAIGLKYALLIGVIAAIFSIIPYLGVILSIAPALLVAFTQSGGDWGYVALTASIFAVVQFSEGWFISPRIMGERTGLHPMTIIISILVWSTVLGGLLGAILAIPLTATLKVLMYRYVWTGTPLSQKEEPAIADKPSDSDNQP